jgi:hypothetical protein
MYIVINSYTGKNSHRLVVIKKCKISNKNPLFLNITNTSEHLEGYPLSTVEDIGNMIEREI